MEALISVENFEDGETAREINSPRSLESCLRSGLDPSELFPKTFEKFSTKNLTKEMVDIKLGNFEKKRREKVMIVKIERNSIIQYAERHNQLMNTATPMDAQAMSTTAVSTSYENQPKESACLFMEERRIDALRKRQEKDFGKIVEREQIMISLQLKIKRVEDEDVKKKKLHEKKVADNKAEASKKNLIRLHELVQLDKKDTERKKELARKDQEFDQKMKLQALEAEKDLAREVKLRDEERLQKLEESRRRTNLIIQAQIDQGEENRLKMIIRENKVQEQLFERKETKKEEARNEKEKSMKRIGEALEKHYLLHEKKKLDYLKKQKDANERVLENVGVERQKLKKLTDDRENKNKQRLCRLLDAHKTRSTHRSDLIDKRAEKDKIYERCNMEREAHQAMLKFASDMKINDKIENVERVARMNEFHRLQTLKRIEDTENRYDDIQRKKAELLNKHKEDMKFNITRKHEINDVMDQMRVSNDFTILDKLFIGKKNRNSTLSGGTIRDLSEGDDDRLSQTA